MQGQPRRLWGIMATAKSSMGTIGFIGAGNMAGALIKGLLAAGAYAPEQIVASDVDGRRLQALRRRHGIHTTRDNVEVAGNAGVVVLAVKPQIIDAVLDQLPPAAVANRLFLSIAAGVTTRRLEQRLGGKARVLRSMPNTPALLGRGVSVLVRGTYARPADAKLGLALLRTVGDALAVDNEGLLDAVTGLSGSGPAYVYRFAEGLIAGGVAAGLAEDVARRLAFQTIAGAAAMLIETGESPETLRAQVTSPGGTTLAGLEELERRGFKDAVAAGVVAATKRSVALGKG